MAKKEINKPKRLTKNELKAFELRAGREALSAGIAAIGPVNTERDCMDTVRVLISALDAIKKACKAEESKLLNSQYIYLEPLTILASAWAAVISGLGEDDINEIHPSSQAGNDYLVFHLVAKIAEHCDDLMSIKDEITEGILTPGDISGAFRFLSSLK